MWMIPFIYANFLGLRIYNYSLNLWREGSASQLNSFHKDTQLSGLWRVLTLQVTDALASLLHFSTCTPSTVSQPWTTYSSVYNFTGPPAPPSPVHISLQTHSLLWCGAATAAPNQQATHGHPRWDTGLHHMPYAVICYQGSAHLFHGPTSGYTLPKLSQSLSWAPWGILKD